MNDTAPGPLPDFDAEWNYNQPQQTALRFDAILRETRDHAPPHYTAELLTQIARTHSLQRAFDEAYEVLAEVDAMLAQPGMQTARVRYLLEKGRTHNSVGQPQRACQHFEQAWREATRLQLDGYAVDAAHMLGIASEAPHRLRWNERAWDLANTSPQPRARKWRGSLANNIGWYHFEQADYATALTFFEQALAARRDHGSASDVQVAEWCVAKALRYLDRCDEALAILRRLEAEPLPDAQPGYTFEEIGECLLITQGSEKARPYFARAHAALQQDRWLAEHEAERLARLQRLGSED